MNKNTKITTLVFNTLVFVIVLSLAFAGCKKKKDSSVWNEPYSPQAVGDSVPAEILPAALHDTVTRYITLYKGDNPPHFSEMQFVSHPHRLLYSTSEKDTIGKEFNDRYIAFKMRDGGHVDFYGKQWDDEHHTFYEEVYRNLVWIGNDDEFTCYYLTEGYPNGKYDCYSTIFSGKWKSSYGGVKDFQVAVVLLETSGNEHLDPVNTFRVLGDADGLATNDPWLTGKTETFGSKKMTDEDLFRMFRKK